MKYCQECGYQCADEVRFCEMCRYEFKVMPVAEPVMQQMQVKNLYNQNFMQQPKPVTNTFRIKNIVALIAAVVCSIPFFAELFACFEAYGYEVSYTFLELCKLYGDLSYCTSFGEKMVACVVAVLPLLVAVLVVVLVISVFNPIIKAKRYLVTACILATITMSIFVSGESGGLVFKGAYISMLVGLIMAAISCVWDKPEPHSRVVYTGEWRCPKCDTRNSAEQKVCKACRVSRP